MELEYDFLEHNLYRYMKDWTSDKIFLIKRSDAAQIRKYSTLLPKLDQLEKLLNSDQLRFESLCVISAFCSINWLMN
jgi:hypothetical protein